MYGRIGDHAESVVVPCSRRIRPVVTWWPGAPDEIASAEPLGALADRRITDAAASGSPLAALLPRTTDYGPGDTDLGWPRSTWWRALLAAILDQPYGESTGGAGDRRAGIRAPT